jgi:very-short-patch-repair endonuclease
MTDAEQKLWYRLRRDQLGVRFYRQRTVGSYIVDFYAPRAKLVIEVDGGQHFEDSHLTKDRLRDEWLKGQGLCVLRFNNREVLLETDAVMDEIYRVVCNRGDF